MKQFLLLPIFLFASCQAEKKTLPEAGQESPEVPVVPEKVDVLMKTSKGDITLELDGKNAPISVKNFLSYVDEKFYDGVIFHRVIDGFMIQTGGFTLKDGIPTEKANDDPIKNEGQNGLSNSLGTIAMARTSDLDSATSQFFINVGDNSSSLDYPANGGYAVFGKVTAGMDVVNKIKGVNTDTKYMNSIALTGKVIAGPHQNVPITPIVIESIRRVK